ILVMFAVHQPPTRGSLALEARNRGSHRSLSLGRRPGHVRLSSLLLAVVARNYLINCRHSRAPVNNDRHARELDHLRQIRNFLAARADPRWGRRRGRLRRPARPPAGLASPWAPETGTPPSARNQ